MLESSITQYENRRTIPLLGGELWKNCRGRSMSRQVRSENGRYTGELQFWSENET